MINLIFYNSSSEDAFELRFINRHLVSGNLEHLVLRFLPLRTSLLYWSYYLVGRLLPRLQQAALRRRSQRRRRRRKLHASIAVVLEGRRLRRKLLLIERRS